jgi:hypothetical protein
VHLHRSCGTEGGAPPKHRRSAADGMIVGAAPPAHVFFGRSLQSGPGCPRKDSRCIPARCDHVEGRSAASRFAVPRLGAVWGPAALGRLRPNTRYRK